MCPAVVCKTHLKSIYMGGGQSPRHLLPHKYSPEQSTLLAKSSVFTTSFAVIGGSKLLAEDTNLSPLGNHQ
ncbi:hypothetical protein QTP88_007019 [Uroleucon formosanum]